MSLRFDPPLIPGKLIERVQRFLVRVMLEGGEEVIAHCGGAVGNAHEKGNKVLLSRISRERSRFGYLVEIIFNSRVAVGVHSGRSASLLMEAVSKDAIPELVGYLSCERHQNVPRAQHYDVLCSGNSLRPCYIAVKSISNANAGIAKFPQGFAKNFGSFELQELTNLVRSGHRAMIFIVVPRADVTCLRLADDTEPEFCALLRDTVARGVEFLCYNAKVTKRAIELLGPIPADLNH